MVQEVAGVEVVAAAPGTRPPFWNEPWAEAATVTRGATTHEA
ncbi:hypothetical protein ACFWMQ_10760 [Streptomyces sp. NPDC058372]